MEIFAMEKGVRLMVFVALLALFFIDDVTVFDIDIRTVRGSGVGVALV